ncbi:HAD family hydrolase [Cellvibrio japonicus]|uniref:CbbY n=1 Tax=Cellvibrio japonicus (strain Ueda107) TaxID=498211 RepID=B3PH89_CELJU|nr:HAD family phosphatase [Cellvibrio japonicus]ACE83398.1 CbbY [Cellvibrio japonicus Ueda107]QEI11012.1 HAD family phosphatase [Cellvibrio japonicus]QEI14587.1 HAD family phosphatase [Cellvibrio japonicus]QEI18166.1 HAD family phosphatase [Cellvibrio japonicus]
MLKAILFDHDGTLVDSEEVHYQLWREIMRAYAVDLSAEEYRDYYSGIPTAKNALDLTVRHQLPIDAPSLAAQKHQVTRDYIARTAFPLMPHADATVRRFAATGAQLAVVTGSTRNCVDATLAAYQWQPLFSTIVSSEDVSNNKPAPDSYLLALQRLGLSAQEAIAIEDTAHGLQAATRAGITCVAVRNAMSQSHDLSNAIQVFNHLQEAADWVVQHYRF